VTLQDVRTPQACRGRLLPGAERQRPGGRAELADRVVRAAKSLRYVSNAPAQALARATSTVVGLIVHAVDDPYFSAMPPARCGWPPNTTCSP